LKRNSIRNDHKRRQPREDIASYSDRNYRNSIRNSHRRRQPREDIISY
jgi:hypothetical protein